MSKKRKNIQTFYVRFYQTGEFRKVEAENESEAYKLAAEKFGESNGRYTIGLPLRNGDRIPVDHIPLKRT